MDEKSIFKIGDKVMHVTGGPLMILHTLTVGALLGDVLCSWMNHTVEGGYQKRQEWFRFAEIKIDARSYII